MNVVKLGAWVAGKKSQVTSGVKKALLFIAALGMAASMSMYPLQAKALPDSPSYVALGDSVAAGAGLPVNGAAGTEDYICGRSAQAYPYLIAADLGTTFTHLACSGAQVEDGIRESQRRGGCEIAAQLPRAFENGTPDLITVTAGANDVTWAGALAKCYQSTCGSKIDSGFLKLQRGELRWDLFRTLQSIKAMSGESEPPKVLISGYFTPIASVSCVEDRITLAERNWIRSQASQLNQAIKSATSLYSFAEYVPVSFAGHELCSDDPWIQTVDEAQPVHPTAAGQRAIADAFLKAAE